MADHDITLRTHWRRTGVAVLASLILGVGLFVVINHIPRPLQKTYADPLKALVVLLVGALVSTLLERYVFQIASRRLAGRRLTWIRFVTRLVLYVAVILAILAAFGLGLSSVVFGGAFFTVLIGLAGQSMFGNLIAGISLVIFHPFEVGDRITFVAWQYPVLMPSFPHEPLKPGYSGMVTDLSLMYTMIQTDDGVPMVIPNGIIIQAAIENHARTTTQRTRMRFDVDLAISPAEFLPAASQVLADLGYTPRVAVVDMGPSTFSVAISLDLQDQREETVKSDVLTRLITLIQEFRAGGRHRAGAGAGS
ncbi:MAG: mechanosensitive ion channel family protein [Thermaerobacter sp.]|nr:mechanosensitive ion channel family protein [Thermaerobacter sp.]